jgi:calcineurin-like phosphoesterase family protein
MTIRFTADTHIRHANRALDRGYSPETHGDDWVEEHDNEIMEECCRKQKQTDVLIHVGDVAWGRWEKVEPLLKRIKGKKILVVGNHDADLLKRGRDLWDEIHYLYTLKNPLGRASRVHPDPSKPPMVVLCHYPMASWERSHYGAWHLHGHSHGKMPPIPGRLDVGWDVHRKLLEWPDLIELFKAGSPHAPRLFAQEAVEEEACAGVHPSWGHSSHMRTFSAPLPKRDQPGLEEPTEEAED